MQAEPKKVEGGEVLDLRPDETPGIDIEVIVGCGDTRQIKLRTMIGRNAAPESAHAIVDKVLAIGDRQKARYDLESQVEEMNRVATTLTGLIASLPIAQANYIADQEKRREEFRGYEADYAKLHDEGYEEHVKSGRSAGSFQPKGARKSNMERLKMAAGKKREEIDRAKAEAEQLFQTQIKSAEHYREDLAKRREKVNGLRRIAGLLDDLPPFPCETCELPKGVEA